MGEVRDRAGESHLRPQIELLIADRAGLLQAALDSLPQAIAIVDAEGITVAVNATAQRYVLTTQGRSWLPGTSFEESLNACPVPEVSEALRACLPGLISGEAPAFERTYEVKFEGRTRVKRLRMTRFEFGEEPLLVMVHEDVTELAFAYRQVDALTEKLLATQEEERGRIGRELHDSTSQHLVAASLALSSLRTAQERAGALLVARADTALADAVTAVGEAQKEIRLLSFLLHPPNLERDGLVAGLRAFVSGFSRRSGLKCTLEVRGDVEGLDLEMEHSMFRVAQEALINVHRHAEASGAAVTLARDRRNLSLIVSDDGRGAKVSLDAESDALGVGIPGMRARLRQLGGALEIAEGPKGLTVKAVVPLTTTRPMHPFVLGAQRHPRG